MSPKQTAEKTAQPETFQTFQICQVRTSKVQPLGLKSWDKDLNTYLSQFKKRVLAEYAFQALEA
jgi:hypothetical protein